MKIFYTTHHQLHHPVYELFNGEQVEHPEIPERLENILGALKETGHQMLAVTDVTNSQEILRILSHIHDPQYLDWLQTVSISEPLYPSVFNPSQQILLNGHPSIQWGNFVSDTFTPLLPHTWQVAFETTQAVYYAVQEILHGSQISVVISRPPGHHAGRSKVGGYCYLNNAGLAAQLLCESSNGKNPTKVAILDVDYHHGNGTQDIFYDRSNVITCSIHAHPCRKFPYFAGFENEVGSGEGLGCNRNYPLPADITNDQYQPILENALEWIESHHVKYLVVGLGLDTHESDPICDFQLTTSYYRKMARTIAQLKLPTIVILEGGYSTSAIGENVVSFLEGMEN